MTTLAAAASGPTNSRSACRHAVLAKARVEAGRMARRPVFLVGVASAVSQIKRPAGVEGWTGPTLWRRPTHPPADYNDDWLTVRFDNGPSLYATAVVFRAVSRAGSEGTSNVRTEVSRI